MKYLVNRILELAKGRGFNEIYECGKKYNIDDDMYNLYLSNLDVIPSVFIGDKFNNLYIDCKDDVVTFGQKKGKRFARIRFNEFGELKEIKLNDFYLYNELIRGYQGGRFEVYQKQNNRTSRRFSNR